MDIVLQFIKLLGGLGMFLFGMNTMSTGIERAAGDRMKQIMEKVTSNLFKSVLLGVLVAGLTQSSSATTVMVVGFVNAGILNLSQAVGIIMGANIGTTVTAWIISLNDIPGGTWYLDLIKPDTLAPLALIVGACLMFFGSGKKKGVAGEVITGFGVLFIGMEYMSDSMSVVFDMVPALQNLFAVESNPLVGILIGTGVTALIQSSSASVGMLQAIATTGNLLFATAVPIIMGQNIGTCVTALLASLGTSKNAKRAAMIHLYFNIIGTLVFLTVIYTVQALVGWPFWNDHISATQISIFHSVFNVTTTLLLLPFNKFLVWLANFTLRDKEQESSSPFALLDKRFLSTPAIAISNTKSVMSDMCELAKENVKKCRIMLSQRNTDELQKCRENEEMLDKYEIKLTDYLTQVSDLPLSAADNQRVASYFHMITNIERIGDYCDNLCECIELMEKGKLQFTEKAQKGLETLLAAAENIVDLTFEAFRVCEPEAAKKIEPLEEVIDSLQEQLEKAHMARLKTKECSVEAGVVYLELLSNIERISDHCSNIGVAILQAQPGAGQVTNRHAYLRELHAQMPEDYRVEYEKYKKMYAL